MADPTSPTGNALQLPGAAAHPVGAPLVSVCGAAADSIPSLGFAQDGHQRPTGGPLPLGTDAYSPVSPGFVMMPQRPTQQPVAGMELPQMVKLSDRVSQAPGPMGMVGLSGLPKTPPKSLPARPQPEGGGMTPDSSRAGKHKTSLFSPPLDSPVADSLIAQVFSSALRWLSVALRRPRWNLCGLYVVCVLPAEQVELMTARAVLRTHLLPLVARW